MTDLTRRQLLQTTAAGAVLAMLPETAEAGFGLFRGGAAVSTTNGTTAQAAEMVSDMNHRISFDGFSTLFLPPWNQGASQGDNPGAQYSSQDTLAAGSFPTTMTLVQDGTIAGGVPTQSFGWVFRPGDIPAGNVPVFTGPGAIVWGFSAGLWVYWPDGSLRWAAFALMPPTGFAPALNSTTTIAISNGGAGTWPASSRTLSEVYAQNLAVNGLAPVSFTVPHNARSASMYALLNGDSNQYYAVKDLDGAAGARWTIKTKMQATTTANGTPDPQFVVTHRIFALNTPSGALAGFRWFGEIRNPFYNDSTGAKLYQVFEPPNSGTPSAGLNWQTVGPGGSGTVNNRPIVPGDAPAPFFNGAKDFTGSISGSVLTVTGGSVPTGFLTVGAVVTAQWTGSQPLVVTGWDSSMPSMTKALFLFPDGTVTYCVPDTAPPDGGNGNWSPYIAPAPFGPSQIVVSNTIATAGTGGGLFDGGALTGQYQIDYQLTVAGGDLPGQRGTYQLSGTGPTSISARAMTYWSGYYVYSRTTPSGYYSGGKQGNVVPCVLTGTLPSTSFYGGTSPCDGTNGSVVWPVFGGIQYRLMPATYIPPNGIVYNDVAIGTLTPVPAFAPFTRFNMATAEGKYNFFQGAGSVAADTTLRVQINQTYWNSTGTFMPMDMSVIGGPMWPLPDTPWQYPWNPYTVTDVRTADIGTGGPPVEVGLMCNVAGWDFYIQTKQSDIWNRAFGLSPGTMYCDFKDGTAGSYFDRLLVMNGPGGSYANMPPFRDSPYIACPNGPSGGPGNGLGFSNQPPPGCSTSGLCEPSHEPDLCQWAYMRFGEVQYFDYMCEWAQTSTQTVFNSSNELSSPPYPYPTWASSIYAGQYRATGWATRDVCQAAFWCSHDPSGNVSNPVFSDGSELQKYLLDQANAQTAFAIAMMDSASATLWGSQEGADYIKASGMWAPKYTASNPAGIAGMQMWQSAYTAGGIMPSALRGDPNAIDFIKRWMGFLDRIGNNTMLKGNSANAYVYHFCLGETIVIQPPGTNNQFTGQGAYPPITRDEQYGGLGSCFSTNTNAIISYVPNVNLPDTTTVVRNAFTMTINPGGVGAPTLGNGDFFFAYASEYVTGPVHPGLIPSAMTQCTVPYFVRDWTNVGGNTYSFNVATSPGGAAIPIVDTSAGGLGPMDGLWHCATPGVDNGVSNAFICQVRNTVCWIHAIGSGQATNPGHNANQFAGFT